MSAVDSGKGLLQGGTQDFSTEFYLTQFKVRAAGLPVPSDMPGNITLQRLACGAGHGGHASCHPAFAQHFLQLGRALHCPQ